MKKRLSVLMIFILIISLLQCISFVTFAAGTQSSQLVLTVTADKYILPTSGGTIKLSFHVQNNGSTAENVKIFRIDQNDPLASTASIAAGQSYSTDIANYTISGGELDTTIKFRVEWGDGNTVIFYNTYDTFKIASFMADFDLDRDVSSTVVKKGSDVTVKYTITNTGNVNLSYPRIYDFGNLSTQINPNTSNDPIEPGETYVYTLVKKVDAALTSAPKVVCIYYDNMSGSGTSKTKEKTFSSILIDLESVNLDIVLSAGKSTVEYGKSTDLVCTVNNKSNVPLKNVTIYDHTGAMLDSSKLTMAVGESFTRSRSITPSQTTEYVFKITYTNPDNESATITEFTSAVKVAVDNSGAQDVILTLVATADTTALDVPGEVQMHVKVTNDNEFTVNNIEIKEAALGLSQTIETLAPGGEQIIDFTAAVDQTSNALFYATVPNDDGDPYTFYADALTITVKSTPGVTGTLGPTDTSDPNPTQGISTGTDWIKVLLTVLGVILGLIVLVTATLIVINIMQKKQAAKDVVVKRKIKDKEE